MRDRKNLLCWNDQGREHKLKGILCNVFWRGASRLDWQEYGTEL